MTASSLWLPPLCRANWCSVQHNMHSSQLTSDFICWHRTPDVTSRYPGCITFKEAHEEMGRPQGDLLISSQTQRSTVQTFWHTLGKNQAGLSAPQPCPTVIIAGILLRSVLRSELVTKDINLQQVETKI